MPHPLHKKTRHTPSTPPNVHPPLHKTTPLHTLQPGRTGCLILALFTSHTATPTYWGWGLVIVVKSHFDLGYLELRAELTWRRQRAMRTTRKSTLTLPRNWRRRSLNWRSGSKRANTWSCSQWVSQITNINSVLSLLAWLIHLPAPRLVYVLYSKILLQVYVSTWHCSIILKCVTTTHVH